MILLPQVALAVAVWVEAVLYGIYVPLFFEAMFIMLRKRSTCAKSANVFLVGSIVLFLLSTVDIGVNLLRFLRAFVLNVEPPVVYFFDWTRWENLVHSGIIYVATWIGDALAIYRCYLVWDRKTWVLILPLILLFVSIGVNIMLFVWFTHPDILPPWTTTLKWMGTVYPLAFGQNIITTGMISFKVWKQHRDSAAMGVVNGSSVALFTVLRIIIESAMIYTIQLLILIICFPSQSWVQAIIQDAIVPSIGIVFVLIAVRVHYSRSRASETSMGFPTWLDQTESDESSTNASNNWNRARHSVVSNSPKPTNGNPEDVRFSLNGSYNRRRQLEPVDDSEKQMDGIVDLPFASRHSFNEPRD